MKRDVGPEHGKITMLGGGYGEMSDKYKSADTFVFFIVVNGDSNGNLNKETWGVSVKDGQVVDAHK